jgi:hypothetical protein
VPLFLLELRQRRRHLAQAVVRALLRLAHLAHLALKRTCARLRLVLSRKLNTFFTSVQLLLTKLKHLN